MYNVSGGKHWTPKHLGLASSLHQATRSKELLELFHKVIGKHTRIVLHCMENQSSSIVVTARDTDVLVLLLAHFPKMPCSKIWMKAGTATKRKYIPIHSIVEQLSLDDSAVEDIIAFTP